MCSDVQNKRSNGNSHILTLVIGVPDTPECLTPEAVSVCVWINKRLWMYTTENMQAGKDRK